MTQILARRYIKGKYTCALKIMTSLDNSIGVGVIDERYIQIKDADEKKLPNYAMYFGNEGQLLVGGE